MCGLFGWVGDDPKKFNKDKFDKLGIFNEARGIDSCGIAVDGELYKGVRRTSTYSDFIEADYYPSPREIPVVIGHTRKATGGSPHTKENAHPFRYDDAKQGFFIGAHNGTIRNKWELSEKYKIDDQINKIDSQVLLEILFNEKVEVLEDYKGYAALLIYSSIRPDTIFIYRGESSDTSMKYHTKPERPLFYYQENENSMYISSMEESLKSIVNQEHEKEDNIYEVETNRLYEIKAGKVINKYVINRSDVWDKELVPKPKKKKTTTNSNTLPATSSTYPKKGDTPSTKNRNLIKEQKENNIFYEKIIFNKLEQDIYYENLRYKRNGHLVTGICIFIKEIGLIRIALNEADLGKILSDYSFVDTTIDSAVPFGNIKETPLFYLYEGILLKSVKDYRTCIKGMWKKADYTTLCCMSEYPIIDIVKLEHSKGLIVNKAQQGIINDKRVLFTGIVSPIGSNADYHIKNGNLTSKVELDDMTRPETAYELSLYEGIDDIVDITPQNMDTFEEGLSAEVITASSKELIESLIEVYTQFEEAFNSSLQLIPHKDDSKIAGTLLEFSEAAQTSFQPIKFIMDGIMQDKEELKTAKND